VFTVENDINSIEQTDVTSKRVLICGAIKGIREQLVYEYAKAGANLVIVARGKNPAPSSAISRNSFQVFMTAPKRAQNHTFTGWVSHFFCYCPGLQVCLDCQTVLTTGLETGCQMTVHLSQARAFLQNIEYLQTLFLQDGFRMVTCF